MKEDNKNSTDDLLIQILTGLASENEILEFEHWLAASENNQNYFRKFKSVLDSTSNLKDYEDIDVESSLKNVKKRIDFGQTDNKIRPLWMLVRVAAVLVLFLGIYLIFKSKSASVETLKMVKIEATNELKTAILPDSTVVTLNLASSIEYPEKFEGNERRVKFEGEAYFKVTPNKAKPFIIETAKSEVRVVGTAFNFRAINNSKTESVIVTEGVVLFSGKANETKTPISLKIGQKGILDSELKLLKREDNKDLNFMSWKTGIFEFSNVSLNDALNAFSGFYKCKFEIIDVQLKSYQFSGKYEKLKIEELIEVLEMTMNVKIEDSNGTYLIKAAK